MLQLIEHHLITSSDSSPSSSSLSEYFASLPLDSPHGRDALESMFRSFSAVAYELVFSVDQSGGSGGYFTYMIKMAAEKILGKNIWGEQLIFKVIISIRF